MQANLSNFSISADPRRLANISNSRHWLISAVRDSMAINVAGLRPLVRGLRKYDQRLHGCRIFLTIAFAMRPAFGLTIVIRARAGKSEA